MVLGQLDIKNEMTHNSYCTQKINSICIVHLNMKFKTMKILEDSIEKYLYDLRVGKGKSIDLRVGILISQIPISLTIKKTYSI